MTLERHKADIERLIKQGDRLYLSLTIESDPEFAKRLNDAQRDKLPSVRREYQIWYSESLALIRQLLPDRLDDFVGYYKPLKARKVLDPSTYTISDFLQGITVTRGDSVVVGFDAAVRPLQQQVNIVKSLRQRFESSLFDIRALTQADLFDNELDSAEELNKKGFVRGAGAITGVVLEEHLASVARQHGLKLGKHPVISELNDVLKKNDILDIPTWRFVQRLGDLRNLCDHKKHAEPTKENIAELIEGVRKIIKTVF